MTVHKCDRCLSEIEGNPWIVQLGPLNGHPMAQYVPPAVFELCSVCESELKRFAAGGAIETSFRRGPRL